MRELVRRGELEPGGRLLLATGAAGSAASIAVWRELSAASQGKAIRSAAP